VKNRAEVEGVIYGSWAGRLLYRIKHLLNRNTKANSQKNIHAHYDLGNAFYSLWLDDTMNYSSALFSSNLNQPMAIAQKAKVRRALQEAGVQAGDRVLEIGCGWGALAEMATTEFQAGITGVTLSIEQLAFAEDRMRKLGVQDKADLRLQDYRDIQDAPFDAICSIEMVEAVGREYWPTYFATIANKLKAGGRACIQSIVIDDALFERYIASTDFIQQYIFPGGCLPCPKEFRTQARAAGLDVVNELTTMRRPSSVGAMPSWKSAPRYSAKASMSGLCASGSSTSATARQPSWKTTSTSCNTPCASPTEQALTFDGKPTHVTPASAPYLPCIECSLLHARADPAGSGSRQQRSTGGSRQRAAGRQSGGQHAHALFRAQHL